MSRTSRQVQVITREYEQWMTSQLPFVINKHLSAKHKRMAGRGSARERKAAPPPFAFLRATFYLWAVRAQEHIGDHLAADVPRVVGIGDVHLENFGTWRDAEGRLVWGANDLDEATRMPYTNDLIRLATSATLAQLKINRDRIAREITCGYRDALRTGPRPFVLAEHNRSIAKIALQPKTHPKQWWDKQLAEHERLPRRHEQSVTEVVETLRASFADNRVTTLSVGTRQAGLGSLGRPRIVTIGEGHGSRVCREAKALLPSAWDWAHGHPDRASQTSALLASPYRATDPYAKVVGDWSMRRLAPDSDKIDIIAIRALDQTRLLHAMGQELANVHVTNADPHVLLKHLPTNSHWLSNAAAIMSDVVQLDHMQYARSHRKGT
jgi:hypothetical protein